MDILTYKNAASLYLLLFLALTHPYWFGGEVIAPCRQYADLGMSDTSGATQVESRKFTDFSRVYIPKITSHLHGNRSGWLTLWTIDNEFGRPESQLSGFSPAWFPAGILAHLTGNPYLFITILSLGTCFLTGLFLILYCREENIAPLAALVAGISLAASPLFMYWLTFPMFLSARCWSVGALWAVTCLSKKNGFIGWVALAFSIYSLLMTAYPQAVVYHAYLLGAYGVYLLGRTMWARRWQATLWFTMRAFSAVAAGVILVFPVYRDLAVISAESARTVPDLSFFTMALPKISSFQDALRFFALGTTPELLGNPISQSFPAPYGGLSMTPVMVFFASTAFCLSFKKTWGWWLAIAVVLLLIFVHPFYAFSVKYLGFNLSRTNPLGVTVLPLMVIIAFGADALMRCDEPAKRIKTVLFSTSCCLLTIAVGCGHGFWKNIPIHWEMLVVMFVLTGLLAAQYNRNRPVFLLVALAFVLATISYRLMLHQSPNSIAQTSPFVEKVRKNLPQGARFAVAAPGISLVSPNINASLCLASAHSYNSLSSTRYHYLVKELGGEMRTYGRYNLAISPDYSAPMFWMSNIALILSPRKLAHENLAYLGIEAGVHFHKVLSRMDESLQVLSAFDANDTKFTIADPRLVAHNTPVKKIDRGDILEFAVTRAETESLFILSQKFHYDWRAQALTPQGWRDAPTKAINEVFLGVLLPADTERVRLAFKPWARLMWIGHIFWTVLSLVVAAWWITFFKRDRQRLRSSSQAALIPKS